MTVSEFCRQPYYTARLSAGETRRHPARSAGSPVIRIAKAVSRKPLIQAVIRNGSRGKFEAIWGPAVLAVTSAKRLQSALSRP